MRAVIHPHAGGSIEFADEIERLANDIPHDVAGLCLDTGHLYYAGMDPLDWLDRYYHRRTICTSRMSTRRFISALSMKVSTSSLPAPKG